MERRDFLKYGAAGIACAGAGLLPAQALAQTVCRTCGPPVGGGTVGAAFTLNVTDIVATMVEGTRLNMLGFGRVPGPVLRVTEGARVQITVTNNRKETHGFEIPGIPGTRTEIAPGCSCAVSFTAPTAGTYLYQDPTGGTPLYRILGLHGVLVVEPLAGTTAAGSRTPYSLDKLTAEQRRVISALFDAFGTPTRFPGGKWVPAPSKAEFSNQEKVWVLNEIDPKFNALLVPGQPIKSNPALTSNVVGNFVPRYFTINNRSGFDLHAGDDVVARNFVGEPTLLRVVNAGLAHHYNHFHGNDLMDLAGADLEPTSPNFGKVVVQSNIFELDTHAVWPTERRDLLLPFEVPDDIPFAIPVSKPAPGSDQFTRMVNGETQEPLPLRYVMHDHVEMSQTAAGGNYPQGMVTHYEILGGVGGRAKAKGKLAAR